jgi:hypothetical protein
MENKKNPSEYEVIDLSDVLSERSSGSQEVTEKQEPQSKSLLNGLLMRYSGGLIKTDKQAQLASVLIIVLMNLITFYLISSSNNGGLGTGAQYSVSVTGEQAPTPAATR